MALERYYTLFHVFKGFNDYFTPDSNLFLDYCLWFLERDFNTLKTCYNKKPERLETPRLNLGEINRVICVFDRPYDKGNPYFLEDAKVQIILTSKEDFEAELNMCKEAGYLYGYVLDTKSDKVSSLGYLGDTEE